MADFEVESRLGDGSYSEVLQVRGLSAVAGHLSADAGIAGAGHRVRGVGCGEFHI